MAQARMRELRALSPAERRQRLAGARRALWDARLKIAAGALQQTHLLRVQRRLIARLETLEGEPQRPLPPAAQGGG
jgi:ribosomal protein L29